MAYTYRPLNACGDCGATWYPRGQNLSHQCPRCGSTNTRLSLWPVLGGCATGCGLMLLALVVAIGFALRPKPAPKDSDDPPAKKTEPDPKPAPPDKTTPTKPETTWPSGPTVYTI